MSSVDHHAEILRSGPAAWNAWRKKRPAIIPHLTGVVLAASERELGGASINLKSARLQDAVFRFATLSTANLQAADLSGADLVHARLHGANLSDANLSGAVLDHADFSSAHLKNVNLRGASLRFTTLSEANLQAADLSRADLVHARFNHADLAGADLSDAVLDYADFAGANLAKVNLSGARLYNVRNLTKAQLEESLGDAATLLPVHLQGCVPWSVAGDHPRLPVFEHPGFQLFHPRGDLRLRRKAFYGPPVRIAGVLLVGAVVATGFVSEIAHEAPPSDTAEAQKNDQQFLPVLPAAEQQASVLSAPAAAAIEETAAPPSLPPAAAEPAAPAAPPIVEPVDAPMQQKASEAVSEVVPQKIFASIELHVTKSAEAVQTIGAGVLITPEHGTVLGLRAVEPESLALASVELRLLTPQRSAVKELRTRMPKLPVLAAVARVQRSVLSEFRTTLPEVRALDGGEPPVMVSQHGTAPASRENPAVSQLASAETHGTTPVSPAMRVDAKKKGKLAGKEADPALAAAGAREPVMLVVSLEAQKIDIYRGVTLITSAKISSGMPGHDTRTGVFSILEKKRRHRSNLYSGAPMPFMQRLTRSGTALHAGVIPGYPASHGCVRLPFSFAPKLFEMTAVGENVVVARARPVPRLIEHPNLFQSPSPNRQMAMAGDAGAVQHRLSDAVEFSTANAVQPIALPNRGGARRLAEPAESETSRHAVEVSRQAGEAIGDHAILASGAEPRNTGIAFETHATMRPSASGDQGHAVAAYRADAPLRILVTRQTAHDRVIAVQYMLADMGYLPRQNFTGNLGTATGNAIRTFQRANGLSVTGAFTDELAQKVYAAAGKDEPPVGHLFVRQDFNRVFDLPIAFRHPEQSLGTHVFTLVKRGDGEAKAQWMAVSLEGGDAAKALDRVEIPDEARRTIAQRLTQGSTLIIGDRSEYSAILPEGDDFLVSAEDPPEGTDEAKVEQAKVEQVKAKQAKPRHARATPTVVVAKPRSNASWRRETRRQYRNRPSSFGFPYLFGR